MMSLREACHRAMWSWLAENPTKNKKDYFIANGLLGVIKRPKHDCFACQEAQERLEMFIPFEEDRLEYDRCYFCPIEEWRQEERRTWANCPCTREGSSYREWTTRYRRHDTAEERTQARKDAAEYTAGMTWTKRSEAVKS